jgi:hypothetical protein
MDLDVKLVGVCHCCEADLGTLRAIKNDRSYPKEVRSEAKLAIDLLKEVRRVINDLLEGGESIDGWRNTLLPDDWMDRVMASQAKAPKT